MIVSLSFERRRKGVFNSLILFLLLSFGIFFISGCSKKSDSSNPVQDAVDDVKDNVSSDLSGLDSLVNANKGAGKGIITGLLQGGSSLSSSFGAIRGKMAANAAGEKVYVENTVPLSGATVLLFDALNPTTAAETTLTTDSTGSYTAVLPEGHYFGFAVYLDLETFSLVTASIPDIKPVADTFVVADTAVAAEDATSPTIQSVFDAVSPNSSGMFLVNGIPNNL